MLQRDDPVTFTQMCKLIFKKHFKSSLSLASPLILSDLVMLTQNRSSNSGLHVFSKKVFDLFKL
jgi:hypothetical protein